jgi:hypothetical protein
MIVGRRLTSAHTREAARAFRLVEWWRARYNASLTGAIAMSEQPENIMLVYLRRLDAKMDRLTEGQLDLSGRVTSLERQVALLHGDFAGQSARLDRVDTRLERIERRLDLVDAP